MHPPRSRRSVQKMRKDAEIASDARSKRDASRVSGAASGPVWAIDPAVCAGAALVVAGLTTSMVAAAHLTTALSERAGRIAAAAAPNPAPSALETLFGSTPSPGRAVAVRAQLDHSRAYIVTPPTWWGRPHWAAPLHAAGADSPTREIRGVLLEPDGAINQRDIAAWVRRAGPAGPLVAFHGRVVDPGPLREPIEAAFAAEGLILRSDAVFIDPDRGGDATAQGARDPAVATAGAFLAGGAATALMGHLLWRRQRRRSL